MSTSPWDRVLIGLIAATSMYALGMIAAGAVVGTELFDRLGFGPSDGAIDDGPQQDYVLLIFGVLGSVLVGWMVLLGGIVVGPFRRREPWAWTAVASSIGVWFVLDTTMSLVLGWPTHAAFNVPFAAGLGLPLFALRHQFFGATQR